VGRQPAEHDHVDFCRAAGHAPRAPGVPHHFRRSRLAGGRCPVPRQRPRSRSATGRWPGSGWVGASARPRPPTPVRPDADLGCRDTSATRKPTVAPSTPKAAQGEHAGRPHPPSRTMLPARSRSSVGLEQPPVKRQEHPHAPATAMASTPRGGVDQGPGQGGTEGHHHHGEDHHAAVPWRWRRRAQCWTPGAPSSPRQAVTRRTTPHQSRSRHGDDEEQSRELGQLAVPPGAEQPGSTW